MSPFLAAILAGSLSALAAEPAPQPGPTRVFDDWIVGCDNRARCTAMSLDDGLDHTMVQATIHWEGGAIDGPSLRIDPPEEARWLITIDGKPIPSTDRPEFAGQAARRLVGLMARGHQIGMRTPDGRLIQQSSLKGLAAALLYIEERQGRVRTNGAIIRPGTRRHAMARHATAILTVPPRSNRQVPIVDLAPIAAADGCDGLDLANAIEPPTIARLDSQSTLVLVPWRCDNGHYNFHASVMVADNNGVLRPAKLDFPGGLSGERDGNDLTNADWDEASGVLSSRPKGRMLNDCGTQNEYAWDGRIFRLIGRAVMPECRGRTEFVPVWRLVLQRTAK